MQDMTAAAEQLEERLKARRYPVSEPQQPVDPAWKCKSSLKLTMRTPTEVGAPAELGLLSLLSCTTSSPGTLILADIKGGLDEHSLLTGPSGSLYG